MDRRGFLKYLSGLPIMGSLFAVGRVGVSEGQREVGMRRSDTETEGVGGILYVFHYDSDGGLIIDQSVNTRQ